MVLALFDGVEHKVPEEIKEDFQKIYDNQDIRSEL
jgi:hypothetical protein